MSHLAAILTIAGSDGSAGAGIQSDLITFYDLNLKGVCVITSIISQVPQQTVAIEKRSGVDLKKELDLLANYYDIQAIKIGLISSVDQLMVIQSFIKDFKKLYPHKFIVLDPVGIASTGFNMQDSEVDLSCLFSYCDLITPNLSEINYYLDTNIDTLDKLQKAAKSFYLMFNCPVLVKGGHLTTKQIHDVYADANQIYTFSNQPIQGLTQWHGTGCKLSSSITGYLCLGYPILKAIELAKIKLLNDYKKVINYN